MKSSKKDFCNYISEHFLVEKPGSSVILAFHLFAT